MSENENSSVSNASIDPVVMPCPWCGVSPKIQVNPTNGKFYVDLYCLDDDCPADCVSFYEMTRDESEIESIKSKIIRQWNTRKPAVA